MHSVLGYNTGCKKDNQVGFTKNVRKHPSIDYQSHSLSWQFLWDKADFPHQFHFCEEPIKIYTAVRECGAATPLYKMLSPPFSQSWQLFTEIKDLVAYDGSSFSLKNTFIRPGEARWSRTMSFSLLLPTEFLTFQVPLFKHTQTYKSTKFLSIITQLYYLQPISGFVSTL